MTIRPIPRRRKPKELTCAITGNPIPPDEPKVAIELPGGSYAFVPELYMLHGIAKQVQNFAPSLRRIPGLKPISRWPNPHNVQWYWSLVSFTRNLVCPERIMAISHLHPQIAGAMALILVHALPRDELVAHLELANSRGWVRTIDRIASQMTAEQLPRVFADIVGREGLERIRSPH